MIVDSDAVVDLERFGKACLSFVDLKYLEMPVEDTFYDTKYDDDRERAVASFVRHVYDNSEDEILLRDTLAFLLNLDDEDEFKRHAWAAQPPFPERDARTLRRFFRELWDRTWADPRIMYFDPDDFEVRGLPDG